MADGLMALLGADKPTPGVEPGKIDDMPEEDDPAQAAGVDAMSAMMDALNNSDPAGAFEALKDAIAAAGG